MVLKQSNQQVTGMLKPKVVIRSRTMAKLPTIKEIAEEVAKEAIERIYAEKPELKELSEAYQDGYEQGKADAIEECIKIVENEKWDYSIIAKLEMLKEQK